MSYPHSITRAVGTVGRSKRLWLLHVVANLALAAAFYGWLHIPEAAAWQVAASAVLAVALLAAFLWLHGGTLNVLGAQSDAGGSMWQAFASAVNRLPALLAWTLALMAVLWVLDAIIAEDTWGFAIGSWLTLTLRRPVSPADAATWLLRAQTVAVWFVFGLWLAMAREILRHGVRALGTRRGAWRQTVTSIGYWLGVLLVWFTLAYLPPLLMTWVPEVEGLWWEAASLSVRLAMALVLALTSWLALLAMVAQRQSADSQQST